MITLEYAASQLKGVIDITFQEASVESSLDQSVDGVFNSFWAIALAIGPALLLAAAARQAAIELGPAEQTGLIYAPAGLHLIIQVISTGAIWAASLWALVMAARRLNAGRRAAALITGYNWFNLLSLIIACIPALALLLSGNPSIFAALMLPVAVINVFMLWRILRATLETDIGVTFALFFVLLLIEIIISGAIINAAGALFQNVSTA